MKYITTILLVALAVITFNIALNAIDKVTERDCNRGIIKACEYIN